MSRSTVVSTARFTDARLLQGLVLVREFILGNNQTGLVTNSSGHVSVVGGEVSSLAGDVISGQLGIYAGSFSTQSTYTYPSATIAAWNSYIVTATAISTPSGKATTGGQNAAPQLGVSLASVLLVVALGFIMTVMPGWL